MSVPFKSLVAQKVESEQQLLSIPGVNAVDVGYKYTNGQRTDEVVIRVHVSKKKKNVPADQMIPAEINGIKTDVIEGTYDAQIVAEKQVDTVDAQADTVRYRPLKCGISIGPDRSVGGSVFAGTMGCLVKDKANGKTMMLSNFHVMCIDNSWHVGDVQNQPSLIDTGTHADGVGTLTRAVLSSHVDGAVANFKTGVTGTANIPGIGNIAGTATTTLGAPVRKRGRTTLLTYGFIDGLSGTVNVNYGGAIGTKTFTNQIFVRPDTARNPKFSDHGDSGSVIVDANNKVVALLFAGTAARTIGNPIAFVEAELNVTVLKFILKPLKLEKIEKIEIKEFKLEKLEHKEKIEKIEHKEIKEVKHEILENKQLVDGPAKFFEIPGKLNEVFQPGSPIDGPILNNSASSDLETRIQQLEAVVSDLSSFIESSLRPDLGEGALSNE
jgi:hypothetical protein